jgi:hypothetical protein
MKACPAITILALRSCVLDAEINPVIAAHGGRVTLVKVLVAEGIRWRPVRSWSTSADPDFAPKGPRSSPSPPHPSRRS